MSFSKKHLQHVHIGGVINLSKLFDFCSPSKSILLVFILLAHVSVVEIFKKNFFTSSLKLASTTSMYTSSQVSLLLDFFPRSMMILNHFANLKYITNIKGLNINLNFLFTFKRVHIYIYRPVEFFFNA